MGKPTQRVRQVGEFAVITTSYPPPAGKRPLWKRFRCPHLGRERVWLHQTAATTGQTLTTLERDVCLRCGKEFV